MDSVPPLVRNTVPSNFVTRRRIRYGALIGAVARGVALSVYVLPLLLGREVPTRVLLGLPLALAPSMIVGAAIGAMVGGIRRTWLSVVIGATLSMLTFVFWSNGPLEWWVLHIGFNFQLTLYFGIAGALTGFLPAVFWKERSAEALEPDQP